jgi:hypothetical protein
MGIDYGQRMPRGQYQDLCAAGVQKRVRADEKAVNPLLHQSRKRRINFATGTSCQNLDLPANRRGRRLHICDDSFSESPRYSAA